jgi:hypothetical protein
VPARGLFRTTTEDVVLHGVTIPVGSRTLVAKDGRHRERPFPVTEGQVCVADACTGQLNEDLVGPGIVQRHRRY